MFFEKYRTSSRASLEPIVEFTWSTFDPEICPGKSRCQLECLHFLASNKAAKNEARIKFFSLSKEYSLVSSSPKPAFKSLKCPCNLRGPLGSYSSLSLNGC